MLIFEYIKTNMRAAMEYRSAFLVQVFGMVLNNSAFIFFWYFLLQRIGGDLNGYAFRDVMYLWSLTSLGFGLSVTFFGNASRLSQLIANGELDVYLLQPAPLLPNILASRMNVSGIGDVIYGILLFAFTQSAGLADWALFAVSAVLSMLMFTAVSVLYHSLTFFIGNGQESAGLAFEGFLSFSIYPGSIFKGPLRWILHSFLPVAWAAWIPAELASGLGNGEGLNWDLIPPLLAGDGLFIATAAAVFHLGVRKYESGNKVGARL